MPSYYVNSNKVKRLNCTILCYSLCLRLAVARKHTIWKILKKCIPCTAMCVACLSNEKIFLHDFVVILKHPLQNYHKILKKYFIGTNHMDSFKSSTKNWCFSCRDRVIMVFCVTAYCPIFTSLHNDKLFFTSAHSQITVDDATREVNT